MRRVISKAKGEMRKQLSSLSFSEKIRILEKLRDRSLLLAASGLRKRGSSQPRNPKTQQFSK